MIAPCFLSNTSNALYISYELLEEVIKKRKSSFCSKDLILLSGLRNLVKTRSLINPKTS
ncbi:hypothetical protein [Streptobacillus moniliformis]|uniref:hypothetical protein n=1 Tax=Streptobacillus moniliformis TaxID=34105 RepID=UPI0012DA4CFA|nr:hypothetical protein [Streptobacillus moniliformis]